MRRKMNPNLPLLFAALMLFCLGFGLADAHEPQAGAPAQEPQAAADAAATAALTPCSTQEYRQFDFWAGSWEVYAPNGQMVGRNVIEPILDGCGLQETWVSATGGRGHSYNFYDATRGKWHQTWIDDSGNPLYLDGALKDGRMVLGDGTNRITWTPLPSGFVRQHWETTADGGRTWTTAFDGEYRPAAGR